MPDQLAQVARGLDFRGYLQVKRAESLLLLFFKLGVDFLDGVTTVKV